MTATMKRRTFLTASGATLLSAAAACGAPANDTATSTEKTRAYTELGVQLYTLRSLFEKDFRSTLKTVADIGYRDLEFAGIFDHDAG